MDKSQVLAAMRQRYGDLYDQFEGKLASFLEKTGAEFGTESWFASFQAAAHFMGDYPLSIEPLPELAEHVRRSVENVTTLGVRLVRFKEAMHSMDSDEAFDALARYGEWMSNPLVTALGLEHRISSMRALLRPYGEARRRLPAGPMRGTNPTWFHPARCAAFSQEEVAEIQVWLLHPFVWGLMKKGNLALAKALIS